VTHPCRDFRSALEAALSRGARAARALGWHEHLLGCAGCRALLASEEALEALLESLPEPHLEAGLNARVLARLALERAREADGLERLLGELPAPAPRGISARVLAGLRAERTDAALDTLLARWSVEPAPAELAARTLARLRRARRTPARRRVALQLAAGLFAAVGLGLGWRAWRAVSETPQPAPAPLVEHAPSTELLEALDLLESWELLNDPSLDVALTSLDEADAILLELERERDPLAADPTKG
jgi:hypothetical protein